MIVKLKGTNCLQDPKYISLILARHNAIIKKVRYRMINSVVFTINIENWDCLNEIIVDIYENTSYGVIIKSVR